MERKGRLAFLVASWGHGGMERVLTVVCKGLSALGWKTLVVTGELRESTAIPKDLDFTVLGGYVKPAERTLLRTLMSVLAFRSSLRRVIREMKPSAVVSLDFFPAWVACTTGARPMVFWPHFSFSALFSHSRTWLLNRWVLKRFNAIVALNERMRQEIIQLAGSRAGKNVMVIPNPITAEYHGNLYEPSTQRLLYVGRLENRQKRIDRLFKAIARIKDLEWDLWLIGDGPHRSELQKLADELSIAGRVVFRGWSKDPWQDVADAGGAKALVLTSDYEGSPQVLIEGMYHGLPCVATDCPVGPSEIVSNGVNGFLVPLADEESTLRLLADKLRVVLQGYEFDSVKIRQTIEKYRPKRVVQQWDELLTSIMSRTPS